MLVNFTVITNQVQDQELYNNYWVQIWSSEFKNEELIDKAKIPWDSLPSDKPEIIAGRLVISVWLNR